MQITIINLQWIAKIGFFAQNRSKRQTSSVFVGTLDSDSFTYFALFHAICLRNVNYYIPPFFSPPPARVLSSVSRIWTGKTSSGGGTVISVKLSPKWPAVLNDSRRLASNKHLFGIVKSHRCMKSKDWRLIRRIPRAGTMDGSLEQTLGKAKRMIA